MNREIILNLCFWVVHVFIGNKVNSQILTVCRNPRIGLPCTLKCAISGTPEIVTFYRNEKEWKSCSYSVNTTECSTKRKASGELETCLRLDSLEKFNDGFWKCSYERHIGTSVHLKPYSFERGEIKVLPVPNQQHSIIILVKAHCVYPVPEVVIRYCSKEMCDGNVAKSYINGCGDSHIKRFEYKCTIDFDNPATACDSTDSVPVQVAIYVNGHHVYNEFTKEKYNGKDKEPEDVVTIYRPLFITVIVGLVFLSLTMIIATTILIYYCFIRRRQEMSSSSQRPETFLLATPGRQVS